jgi:putative spermidine/putrescine transport system permease protein
VRTIGAFLHRRPAVTRALLLALPLLWLGVVYFGSLAALLLQSFYSLDYFTGRVVREFTLSTYRQLFTPANVDVIVRTVSMAASVTIASALIALPVAFAMGRSPSRGVRTPLYVLVLMPLWSSYVVRVYAWKLILAREGALNWTVAQLHLQPVLDWVLALPGIGGPSLALSPAGTFLVFLYIWLPYMILPIAAAVERIPASLLEASGDLGARPRTTFWRVTMPLVLPGIVAGSIFTFSLTLGDYIIPGIVGNSKPFIGQVVLMQQGTAGNIPLAAAFTVVPMLIMGVYLTIARRLGAFEAM